MTAYVHIGTVKTGTTTIQKFLSNNKNILLEYRFKYSEVFFTNCKHDDLAKLIIQEEHLSLKREVISNIKNSEYKQQILKLKNEIDNNKDCKFLFSTEGISWLFSDEKFIQILQKLLYEIGFSKIYIVLYLRNTADLLASLSNQEIKNGHKEDNMYSLKVSPDKYFRTHSYNNQWLCQNYSKVFGKENLIIKIFDKNEFYQGDLLKDFIHSIGLKWNKRFVIPLIQNESIDLLGIELMQRINNFGLGGFLGENSKSLRNFFMKFFRSKDCDIKFQPPKAIVQSYLDYFEESNEWVRKEFFPHKERLFPKKDLSNYKENYELKEMKPEYWDRIAEFIADVVKKKNKIIEDNTNVIQKKDEIIKEKEQIINSKSTQLNQIQSKLSFQFKYGTAKIKIQNQLSYKLGQAMIVNSKSILGYIRMPFVLSYIKDKHKQEQKIYQEKIKKDPSLKLPPLESYPDYQEALKLKNHLSYKLGQALIKANKTWYKGGYVKMLFEIWKLRKYNI
ncbi:hypothetical protein L8W66_06105 [Campylobacter lari]|uniref:hypothetical protein n=1 Tax=Campylobacter lari TaxID=201 RepID=UPI0021E6A49A|nr:hypothetical protein [Campylobacter lari]MCV3332688.1 hypothetical protein [Campylobacter lari]MCV3340301.1 hypothetical protein [Campylobacter lari]MCV3364045.1 hypothetical protein [Campylobacter lari]MCV3407872.1 hypothetical protein [Campylobacter lari]MCV3417062.1 hypothetical protein [Campylobacter lari]